MSVLEIAYLRKEEYHIEMETKELIDYLCEKYRSKETARINGIVYSAKDKTFSIEIDGEQYLLTSNQLSDTPDGVGDMLANDIKVWAQY